MSNERSPILSILMTSYNREKYIAASIESVLASTFTDYEFIIVDDASTDSTVSIIKKYAEKDTRIEFFLNEKNLGDYPNRNRAASYATGKYLKFVDSDDLIYPNALQVMVDEMEHHPSAAFGIDTMKCNMTKPYPILLDPKEAYHYNYLGPGIFHVGPLAVIFKRETFVALNGFLEGRMISDAEMWHRMALAYSLVLVQAGLVWQRSHPDQELSHKNDFLVAGEKIKWNYFIKAKHFFNSAETRRVKISRLKRYTRFTLASALHLKLRSALDFTRCFFYVLTN